MTTCWKSLTTIDVPQHARHRLRGAVDDGDRARVAHARRADDADRAGAAPVEVGRGDQAERPQLGVAVFGADHDRQARAVDVLVQQPHEPLLLFDHPQQRAQRGQRDAARLHDLLEQRRGALDVDGGRALQVRRASDWPAAARGRAAGRRACAPRAAASSTPSRTSSSGGRRTRVQVVGGLHELRRADAPRRCPRLLRHLVAARHHDDQDARAAERHELDALEHRVLVGRRQSRSRRGARPPTTRARSTTAGRRSAARRRPPAAAGLRRRSRPWLARRPSSSRST